MDFDYLFRKYTSSFRKLPNFIIIGAQKAGTTSLSYYLSQHPKIFIHKIKELHYFNQSAEKPINYYKQYFTLKNSPKLNGEATPDYMIYPQIPELIAKLSPSIKLIVLLKNPVERAFSHYKHNLMMKREWLSFEDALEIESKRVNKSYIDIYKSRKEAIKNYSNYAYMEKGIYSDQIRCFYKFFKKEQIKIIQSEYFFKNVDVVTNSVLDFLSLDNYNKINYDKKNVNPINLKFNEKTRKMLVDYYNPHNKKLYELINQDFNWS